MKRLLLIDSSSYIYRAFYALPPLTSPKGMPTGAIYGFVRMMLKLLKDFDPEYIAAVFDTKGKTVRHESFQEYKANRKEAPDDLTVQIPFIEQIIVDLGIKILKMPGYEADDIIATLAKKAAKENYEVIIVSPDKDMLQLIDERIKVYNPVNDTLYDREKVIEKYSVEPSQFIDYLTMIGDSIDNVPGIKGVGPKTASVLIGEYKTLDNIIESKDKLSEKYKKLFENVDKDQIKKSKELITLYDVPINIEIEDLKKKKPDLVKLKNTFQEFGFKSLLKDIDKEKKKNDDEKVQKTLF